MPVRRTATKRKASKARVTPPKEVLVTKEQLAVLTDYLQETLGITLAQAERAARAIKPGSRVLGRGQTPRNAFISYMRGR
jgi:hypothetical protein